MEVLMWIIMGLYGILGGISTLVMVIGIPAIIIWKIYRKVTLGISIND